MTKSSSNMPCIPAQYEAYKSGKAKEDFLEDVAKRRAEKDKSPEEDAKPKTLTVQVDGQAYRVTVAYGDTELPCAPAAAAPAGRPGCAFSVGR